MTCPSPPPKRQHPNVPPAPPCPIRSCAAHPRRSHHRATSHPPQPNTPMAEPPLSYLPSVPTRHTHVGAAIELTARRPPPTNPSRRFGCLPMCTSLSSRRSPSSRGREAWGRRRGGVDCSRPAGPVALPTRPTGGVASPPRRRGREGGGRGRGGGRLPFAVRSRFAVVSAFAAVSRTT